MNVKKCLCVACCFSLLAITVISLIVTTVMIFVLDATAFTNVAERIKPSSRFAKDTSPRRHNPPFPEHPLESQMIPVKMWRNERFKNAIPNGPYMLHEPVKVIPKRFHFMNEESGSSVEEVPQKPEPISPLSSAENSEEDENKNEIDGPVAADNSEKEKRSDFNLEPQFNFDDPALLLHRTRVESEEDVEDQTVYPTVVEYPTEPSEKLQSEESTSDFEMPIDKRPEAESTFEEPSLSVYKEMYERFEEDLKKTPFGMEKVEKKQPVETSTNPETTTPETSSTVSSTEATTTELELGLATSPATATKKPKRKDPWLSAFRALDDEDMEVLKRFFSVVSKKPKSKTKRSARTERIHKRFRPFFPFHHNRLDFSAEVEQPEEDILLTTPEPTTTTFEPPTTISESSSEEEEDEQDASLEISQQQKRQAGQFTGQPTLIQPFALPPLPPPPSDLFPVAKSSNTASSYYRPSVQGTLEQPQKPIWIERLENESSAERTARIQNELQRLIQFVSLLSHVDGYLATRTKTAIKKLSLLVEDDPEVEELVAERRRKRRNNKQEKK